MPLSEQLFGDYCYYRDKTDNVRLFKAIKTDKRKITIV
jgi:hypothetical protein